MHNTTADYKLPLPLVGAISAMVMIIYQVSVIIKVPSADLREL